MKAPLSLIPLLPVTLAFVAGIVFSYFGVPIWCTGLWVIAGIILALLRYRYYAALVLAIALGQTDMWLQQPDESVIISMCGEKAIEADVLSVRESETSRTLKVKVISIGKDLTDMSRIPSVYAHIVIPAFLPSISPGDRIMVMANMSKPDSIQYFPEQLTYKKILDRQGIAVSGITVPDNIYRVKKSPSLFSKFIRLKNNIQKLILRSDLDSGTKEFLVTAITGDSSILDEDTRKTFATAGTAHILALSGLHVAIITAFCSFLLFPLILVRYIRKWRYLVMLILLWIFAIMTGLSPSVTRATIIASSLLLATLLQRKHSSFNALCLAALVILLFEPSALFTISFQLSFAAVCGILLFGKRLNPINQRNRSKYITISFITMSIGAMLATGIISSYYFHTLPVYFLVSNVLIAPILTPLIGGGILLIILDAVSIPSGWLCSALNTLYGWVTGACDTIASLPGAEISHINVSGIAMALWFSAVGMLAIWLHKRRLFYGIATGMLFLSFITIIVIPIKKESFGAYIIPGTYRTDIAICTPDKVDIITTAGRREHEKVKESSFRAFSDYMMSRDIDSLSIAEGNFTTPVAKYTYPLLSVGKKHLLIADSKPTLKPSVKLDYILVCRGYRGTISELMESYNAKLVILSGDLHPKRHSNYEKECKFYDIKYISLKDKPFKNILSDD